MNINETLEQRERTYGDFSDVAETRMKLFAELELGLNFEDMNNSKKTALFIRIAVKPRGLARGYKAAIR